MKDYPGYSMVCFIYQSTEQLVYTAVLKRAAGITQHVKKSMTSRLFLKIREQLKPSKLGFSRSWTVRMRHCIQKYLKVSMARMNQGTRTISQITVNHNQGPRALALLQRRKERGASVKPQATSFKLQAASVKLQDLRTTEKFHGT